MSLSDCIGTIRTALGQREDGRETTDEDAQRIMQAILDRHARRQADGSGGDYGDAARDLAEEAQQAAAIKKRNALANLVKRVSRVTRIEEKAAAIGGNGNPNFVLALQSEIHGINTPVKGGRFSARGEWSTGTEKYVGGLIQDLEHAGLFQTVRSGGLAREWVREVAELNKGDQGQPGITKSPQAQAIAKIMNRWQNLAKADMNREGAWIGDYFGYVTRTSHDADAIRRAGFPTWLRAIGPALDEAKTFEGVDDPRKFMEGVYNALITGVHLTPDGLQGMKDPAFSGPANMARKASEGRVLHFKDADSWFDYNEQFGTSSPLETIIHSLDRTARDVALMRRWGTNPRAEFEADLQRLKEKYRDTNPESVIALSNGQPELANRFSFLDGHANQPVASLGAKVLATMRTIETMGKLGNVAFTHLTTAATKAAELRRNGVGLFEAYGDFFKSLARGRGAGETREIMDLLYTGVAGRQQSLLDRVQADDSLPGTVSRLGGLFMKATGLTYMLNAERSGNEFTLARYLGSNLDKPWEGLKEETRRELLKADIGGPEWELLRNAPDHPTVEGRAFLTPDAANRISAAEVEAHLRAREATGPESLRGLQSLGPEASPERVNRMATDFRDGLAMRLHAYYRDSADRAIVTPDIPERSFWYGGTRPGTWKGEALRSISQFKMWPTAVIRQQIGAELYGGQSKSEAFRGVLALAGGATVLGYMRMAAVDMLNGKNPRAPNDPKTWLAALAQGGGFGILGDYLFGDYSRFGHNLAESLLGPVVGGLGGDVINIYNNVKQVAFGETEAARESARKQLAPEIVRTALSHVPFVNLFYTRLAIEYGFLWDLQEYMSPGYLRRYQANLKRNTGQTFWLDPTQSRARPFTG